MINKPVTMPFDAHC